MNLSVSNVSKALLVYWMVMTISDQETHQLLTTRRDQYKTSALQAKHGGDDITARKFIKISKVLSKGHG